MVPCGSPLEITLKWTLFGGILDPLTAYCPLFSSKFKTFFTRYEKTFSDAGFDGQSSYDLMTV